MRAERTATQDPFTSVPQLKGRQALQPRTATARIIAVVLAGLLAIAIMQQMLANMMTLIPLKATTLAFLVIAAAATALFVYNLKFYLRQRAEENSSRRVRLLCFFSLFAFFS